MSYYSSTEQISGKNKRRSTVTKQTGYFSSYISNQGLQVGLTRPWNCTVKFIKVYFFFSSRKRLHPLHQILSRLPDNTSLHSFTLLPLPSQLQFKKKRSEWLVLFEKMVQPSDQVGSSSMIKAIAESNWRGAVKAAKGKGRPVLVTPPFPVLNGAILVKLS